MTTIDTYSIKIRLKDVCLCLLDHDHHDMRDHCPIPACICVSATALTMHGFRPIIYLSSIIHHWVVLSSPALSLSL